MRTGIYQRHCELGAKIVDFAGWEMPVYYQGIIQEHHAVRQRVGIFDVSHMGKILVTGSDAEYFLDYLSTNVIKGKKDFSATYTVWCGESGTSLDDLLVYRLNKERFFVVANAANRQKDLDHLKKWSKGLDVSIEACWNDGILAIQGPHSLALMEKIFPEAQKIRGMHFIPTSYQGETIILSATGYTGEVGFEIFASMPATVALWDHMFAIGQKFGIAPIGLGARDTLRLEMGFALYGHELSEEIAPTESVASWAVKFSGKGNFLGREVLEHQRVGRHQYGIVLKDRGIAREGYAVYRSEKQVGRVTSGTLSPSIGQAIAIILVEEKFQEGDNVSVQIRDRRCRATVTKIPFYTRSQ